MNDVLEYRTVVLGALLHDIGKLLQRGSFGKLDTKGQHPAVSSVFVRAFQRVFSPIADIDLLDTLVRRHHENKANFSPDLLVQGIADEHTRTLATLVSRADNLSSSERGEPAEGWQDYKATPLATVLERLNQKQDEGLKLGLHAGALPSSSASEFSAIFPQAFAAYGPDELNQHLKRFGADFEDVFEAGRNWGFDNALVHLTGLLYRYTWCIPSNTQEKVPDVSLFDHMKTTAAIAACLYRYHVETGTLNEKEVSRGAGRRFILAVGDLSGIQKYIFDIANIGEGGVAKRLRARSLYVQLLSEVAAHKILHELNLPPVNIVMNSGGRFYLLLPNLDSVKTVLAETQARSDHWLIENFNGELALNMASVEFGDEGFGTVAQGSDSGFGTILRQVNTELQRRKQNRFAGVLQSGTTWREEAFVLPDTYQGREACHSCRKFPVEVGNLCRHCQRDQSTGTKLAAASYVSFFAGPASGEIPALGYSVSLSSQPPGGELKPYLVWKLNDVDVAGQSHLPAGFKYLATHVPREKDRVLDFAEIAQRSNGAQMLGFLKADMDSLGETFVFGLKRDAGSIDTISRQTSVSRQLDVFFSGWVEHLTSKEYKDCYTVFSGGDDLFLVGPWDRIMRLARRMNSDLAKFTGNNELTLSAGVVVARPGYPLATAAEQLEHAVERSKSQGKNRITVLGDTMTWSDWDDVLKEWDRVLPFVKEGSGMPAAFLYDLLRFGEMWRQYAAYVSSGGKEGDVTGLRFHPMLAYNIARNIDRRRTPELYDWAQSLLRWPPGPGEEKVLRALKLTASLLIYSRRGNRE